MFTRASIRVCVRGFILHLIAHVASTSVKRDERACVSVQFGVYRTGAHRCNQFTERTGGGRKGARVQDDTNVRRVMKDSK